MSRASVVVCCLVLSGIGSALRAEEIPYVETFALAADRAEALKQLIPGTEDYYYYHSLHFQNLQQFDRVKELVDAWVQRHGYTDRVRIVLNRQALLTYAQDPQASLDYLREQLNLRFDHQQVRPNEQPQFPTALDPQRITRDTLLERAFNQYQNLEGLEDTALDWVIERELSAERRRDLLRRLSRPDHANLPQLVIDDLKAGATFGDYPIHGLLLREQLNRCRELLPALATNANFVNAYLSKLRPGPDEPWTNDPEARAAYLDRLWDFVKTLPVSFNSLKAHVLYHRLVHDRSQGVYNRERFLEYLQLPRNSAYVRPEYLQQRSQTEPLVDLSASFAPHIPLPPVGDDESLVRSYLEHFFVEATDYEAFAPFLKQEYLREIFAATKIVHGLGDAEQWFSWLSPAMVQALKQRVDLDFAATNDHLFMPDEPVRLEVFVKNVDNLIVKVFEIQTGNYYREKSEEINTDIKLDGLTPNWEYTFKYNEPPVRRVRRQFEFPELSRRGVYVIDFIGNGKSSRALVRKGKLKYLVQPSAAGQMVLVLSEQNELLKTATAEIDGRRFESNENGEIFIPFREQSATRPIILGHDGFYSLERFQHAGEEYQLRAGIYVDREQLLRSKTAKVLVRPGLYLSGALTSLSVLKDVQMRVTATDLDGVTTTYQVPNFELDAEGESEFEIQVPPRLAKLDFQLTGKVDLLSRSNETSDLSAVESYSVNGIETTTHIEDLHLVPVRGGYLISLLGRTGEIRPHRAVSLQVKHRDFRQPVEATLKTDEAGFIDLGELPHIVTVTATTQGGLSRTWNLNGERRTYHSAVHGVAGEALEIPYPGVEEGELSRDVVSLLELREGTFVVDRFETLRAGPGVLHIEGLPPGDYDLLLKRQSQRIEIRLANGPRWDAFVLGKARLLEASDLQPVHVSNLSADDKQVQIQIAHPDAATRVHVLVTRYQPEFDVFAKLSQVRDNDPRWWRYPAATTAYVEGRNIGDEYRYILERRYATKFPGNMLERPSLLLNPWPVRQTETSKQEAQMGDQFRPDAELPPSAQDAPDAPASEAIQAVGQSSLDYLARTSVVMLNLVPDDEGNIVIPRSELGDRQHVHVVLVHPRAVAYHQLALDRQELKKLDLRLQQALDVTKHFTQKQQVLLVEAGQPFVIKDLGSARFELYDDLADIYALYATLVSDAALREFRFVTEWHTLDIEKKREQYSKYACHELDFFLQQKDPAFFESVVQPYLRNKREKQFFDHWLLGDEIGAYQEPARYELLNTVERILLAERAGDRQLVARDLADRLELIPTNVPLEERLFSTSLARSALAFSNANFEAELPQLALSEAETARLGVEFADGAAAAAGAVPAAPGMAGRPKEKQEDDRAQDANNLARSAGRRMNRQMYFGRGLEERKSVERLFETLDKTREWAENQYYHVPLEQMTSELIPASQFWLEYARRNPDQPFYPSQFAAASRHLHEALLALAVIGLPAKAGDHKIAREEGTMTITAASPLLAVSQEIQEAAVDESESTPILISENLFRASDRYQMVAGQRQDKFVRGEFLVQEVYGAQIVVTNPTSSSQQLDVLFQIPAGAVPLSGSRVTRSLRLQLEPFHTQTLEYHFYFPFTGEFQHYPAQVAREEKIVAYAEPQTFKVVEEPSQVDRESWDFVSQQGTVDEVLRFLETRNLHAIALDRIAWRMRDQDFFQKVIAVLLKRHMYEHTLWSYGVLHNQPDQIRDFLLHLPEFVARCGAYLESPLLVIDPVQRRTFQHLEYRPLVNARAHRLGEEREILNDRFFVQYQQLMEILSCRRELSDSDRMAVVYYLLLQDRVAEALAFFGEVNPDQLETRLQYDYFAAYLDFYEPAPERAEEIVARYADYPVNRWREAFAAIRQQLAELRGENTQPLDQANRDQQQGELAARAPQIELKVEGQRVVLSHENLREVKVNFYQMDIELLFSSNPFVQQGAGQFSYVRPNVSQVVALEAGQQQTVIELPAELRNRNVLVEVSGGGISRSQPYYSNSLIVQTSENYGQLRVVHSESKRPLPQVYVKTYAQMQDGTVQFYKDGYTDLRGRFDYATLSTTELERVARFAILILSDEHGATVREVAPPAGTAASSLPVAPVPR